jgi:DNA sulfur modification protein DndB
MAAYSAAIRCNWGTSIDSPRIQALRGQSAQLPALVGFAPASLLARYSSADVLDEHTGRGYQRRFFEPHSLDFRRYIQREESTTIPLTLNLRPGHEGEYRIEQLNEHVVHIVIRPDAGKIFSQVDCQHRLGHLADLDIVLPFLILLHLTETQEMAVFNVINSKAKGLNSSLMDFHSARLAKDLALERPELLIALHLNESEESPWYKQLDLGGNATSGLKRRASLRTMQKAVKRFLSATNILDTYRPTEVSELVLAYWNAIAQILRDEWFQPRRHFLTKGIGVYALMGVLGDLWKEAEPSSHFDTRFFLESLSEFANDFDWSASGPLRGLGGESGAQEALDLLRRTRATARLIRIGARNG